MVRGKLGQEQRIPVAALVELVDSIDADEARRRGPIERADRDHSRVGQRIHGQGSAGGQDAESVSATHREAQPRQRAHSGQVDVFDDEDRRSIACSPFDHVEQRREQHAAARDAVEKRRRLQ